MRIAKLELLAYGPFRGLALDFAAPGLHVVFGRNEAGKSTTLRAITGLLYGIDRQTVDAHVHKPSDLRIGGTLESPSGERIRIVRRKGVTNTLLDPEGEPLDEVALKRLLGGVSEDMFKNAFGLDHDALGAGAQALLEGRGDLGESLFGASVGGGRDVQELVKRLDAEADKLYRPQAKARLVNDALTAFNNAQKAIKERQSLPEAFLTQERAVEEARDAKKGLEATRAELQRRRSELERARKRVPLERRRDRLKAALAEMGPIVTRGAQVDAIRSRSEAYKSAREQQRTIAADAMRLRDRVADAAKRAGIDLLSGKGLVRLDARQEKRAAKLIDDRTRLAVAIDGAKSEIARIEREVERLKKLDVRPASDASASLERVLETARALGDAEGRIATERARAERRRADLEAKASKLGLFDGPLGKRIALKLPSIAAVDALAKRAGTLDTSLERLEERLSSLDEEIAKADRRIAEETGEHAPPDLAALQKARADRDVAYASLSKSTAAAYERLVREADALADRMIREADRVTLLARLRSSREESVRQRGKLEQDAEAARKKRAAIDEELRALFAPAKIVPVAFDEMCTWLERHAQIVEQEATLREREADVEDEARRVATIREELRGALVGKSTSLHEAPLAALVDEADKRVAEATESKRKAAEIERALATHARDLDERRLKLARDEEQLADVRTKLAELLRPLGIEDDAAPEEITGALDALRELFELDGKRADGEARAKVVDAEVREFEEEVDAVVAAVAPDLAGRDTREVVIALADRADKAAKLVQDLALTEAPLAEMSDAPLSQDVIAIAEDPDAAERAIDELDDRLKELAHDISKIDQSIGAMNKGLEQMQSDSNAAEAAIAREQALARLRDGVERWCKAKLAALVLAKEIERYREENEGPLVAGAAKLFSRLTLGAFSGVKSGFDERDRPCLRCVRSSGAEVDVMGLSEGTRDQLYLSLRLATLLRRADVADPMPIVLDDVLIQLDDERAGAALAVLAEVAKKMQVLFFTHHARLVDIAKRAVPKDVLVVHDLDAASRQGSLFASSPV